MKGRVGKCIGGPRDGQMVEAVGDRFNCVEPPRVEPMYHRNQECFPHQNLRLNTVTYEWFHLYKGFGCWVMERAEPLSVLKDIVTGYQGRSS